MSNFESRFFDAGFALFSVASLIATGASVVLRFVERNSDLWEVFALAAIPLAILAIATLLTFVVEGIDRLAKGREP